MPDEFWEWFDAEISERRLNDNGAAKLARISHSVISNARNKSRPIGREAVIKIAKAFDKPASMVLSLAGYIPEEEALSPIEAEWVSVFQQLDDLDREELLAIARIRAKRKQNAAQTTTR